MAETYKGLTIKFGADTGALKTALSSTKGQLTALNKEGSALNRALKFDPTNTTLLAQKMSNLSDKIILTKGKLEDLQEAQDKLDSDGIDENSEEYRKLERVIEQTKQQLGYYENQLEETAASAKKAGLSMEELKTKIGEVGGKVTSAGKGLTAGLTAPIVAAGVAAVNYASDAAESASKVEVAFGDSASVVNDFADKSLESFGLASASALDMASGFGDMATSMDIPQAAAADMSTTLVGLAADLSSYKNVDVSQSSAALNGIFTGEAESLKSLGVIMTDTTLNQYALAEGYEKTTSEMTQAEKVQLRYNYVMDKTQSAQGDFERTSDGTANTIRTFQETLKELAATFGKELLPIITPVIKKITGFVKEIGDMNSSTKKIIIKVAAFAAALGPLLIILGSVMTAVSVITAPMLAVGAAIAVVTASIGAIGVAAYNEKKKVENFDKATVGLGEDQEEVQAQLERTGDTTKSISEQVADASKTVDDALQDSADMVDGFNETWADYQGQAGVLDKYYEVVKELGNQSDLTADQQTELKDAIDNINNMTGLNLTPDEIKNHWESATAAIEASIDATDRAIKRQIYEEQRKELYEDVVNTEDEIDTQKTIVNKAQAVETSNKKEMQENPGERIEGAAQATKDLGIANDDLAELEAHLKAVNEKLDANTAKLTENAQEEDRSVESIQAMITANAGLSGGLTDAGRDVGAFSATLSAMGVSTTDLANMAPGTWATILAAYQTGDDELLATLKGLGFNIPQSVADGITENSETVTIASQITADDVRHPFENLGIDGVTAEQMLLVEAALNAGASPAEVAAALVASSTNAGFSVVDLDTPANEAVQSMAGTLTSSNNISSVSSSGETLSETLHNNIGTDYSESGNDVLSSLTSGLGNTTLLGSLGNAASHAASVIRSYLHFSEPDVGPLSDFHTYAPDMVNGFADGITSNLSTLENAADRVALTTANGLAAPELTMSGNSMSSLMSRLGASVNSANSSTSNNVTNLYIDGATINDDAAIETTMMSLLKEMQRKVNY